MFSTLWQGALFGLRVMGASWLSEHTILFRSPPLLSVLITILSDHPPHHSLLTILLCSPPPHLCSPPSSHHPLQLTMEDENSTPPLKPCRPLGEISEMYISCVQQQQ